MSRVTHSEPGLPTCMAKLAIKSQRQNAGLIFHNHLRSQQAFCTLLTMSGTDIRKHKYNWRNITKRLNDMKDGEDMTFDQLLVSLNITEQIKVHSCY